MRLGRIGLPLQLWQGCLQPLQHRRNYTYGRGGPPQGCRTKETTTPIMKKNRQTLAIAASVPATNPPKPKAAQRIAKIKSTKAVYNMLVTLIPPRLRTFIVTNIV
jgi:hypothetical protein